MTTPMTDAERDAYWSERAHIHALEEFLDGAEPLHDSSDDPTPTHRLRLDMNGATPLSEVDLEESAARAARWLQGES